MKLIVTDDHKLLRDGLKRILLEEYPYAQIAEACNVPELLTKLESETYDCIVSDITMPGISGIEGLKFIKEKAPNTPVLILSMHSPEEYAVRAIRNGAYGYITKESAANELIKAVDTVRNGQKYITPEIAELLADSATNNSTTELHHLLTEREMEVFNLVINWKTSNEISETLSISNSTVSSYKSKIMEKMNLHTNADLVKYAVRHRLI